MRLNLYLSIYFIFYCQITAKPKYVYVSVICMGQPKGMKLFYFMDINYDDWSSQTSRINLDQFRYISVLCLYHISLKLL